MKSFVIVVDPSESIFQLISEVAEDLNLGVVKFNDAKKAYQFLHRNLDRTPIHAFLFKSCDEQQGKIIELFADTPMPIVQICGTAEEKDRSSCEHLKCLLENSENFYAELRKTLR